MMTTQIVYRPLHTMAEFDRVAELERSIWKMPEASSLSGDVLRAITHNGGVVIGAEEKGELVGFSFGLASRVGDTLRLWSHATGVAASHQGQGIGFALKQQQRLWALAHNYDTIAWTYDPMQRGNAKFNLCCLGAVATVYHLDYYGDMTDGLNAGMKSDRFEAVWPLVDERVIALANGETIPPKPMAYPDDHFILRVDDGACITQPVDLSKQWLFAEIPYNLRALKERKLDKAKAWQLALRAVMQDAMAQRYSAVDFVIQKKRCWYVLAR